MACLNALSPDNYMNVNITVAKLFGLQVAVYWGELSRVLPRVQKKKKFDENGFFTLDRNYIEDKTTLKLKDQLKCDQILVSAGIMAVDPKDENRVAVDVQLLLSLIIDGDVEAVTKRVKAIVNKATPKEKRESKIAGMKATMKRYITETDTDLVAAYQMWIDVTVGAAKVNRITVENFQKAVKTFSSDKNVQLEVINLAASHTYIDANWAIKLYQDAHKRSPVKLSPQKVCSSVKDGIEF